MFSRSVDDAVPVVRGNGTGRRHLVEADGTGFAYAVTLVRRGTTRALRYRDHLEACYCVAGSGEVVEKDGTRHRITPGTIYVLDEHDPRHLVASDHEDLHLVSVFDPPIAGTERHTLSEGGRSRI
ncbi:ectoine synthase [Kitasatospora sp. NPDC056651]|uniref:ectoine synthase n=1 Tax=Kitasatospora sp. NPDC056651 TaxID=3345892 RepID=UPI003683C6CB